MSRKTALETSKPGPRPVEKPSAANRIFLIDTMSFIFRAYHAMARQRGMSTKTGLPTAATYVFVNMLRKLRDDFSPEYLAAVFDVSAPTFRSQQAKDFTSVRRFDLKTQTFQEIEYHGYKANRKEMPGDLVQQVPYIRRALEAYRIPILELSGYEADDVIGTLARKAVAESYQVYVVSSDKDMLQLVNDNVLVLNPPKDNLICDAAKVEEILGVPPQRVIDVMALRGDSIDNIPGAPGIGDKGSVDLIKRFGSVEATRNAHGRNNYITFEIHGTEGSIVFNYERRDELQVCFASDQADRRGFRTIYTGPAHPYGEGLWPIPALGIGYGETKIIEAHDFFKAIAEGGSVSPNFADGYQVALIDDAIVESAAKESWVEVPQITD